MDVRKGRTSRTPFQRGITRQKEHWNSSIQMCVAQCHHPPLMGMYTSISGKFKEFKALIENLSERKIKILRLDNGGEYTSKEFISFCRDVGIKRELTTYNPQQNGVSERKNRAMLEAVKIEIFLCAYGQKQLWKLFMCRTDYLIVHLGSRP
jgi:hypothetical protein